MTEMLVCRAQKKHRRLPLCKAWENRREHIYYPTQDLSNEGYVMVYHSENQVETLLSLWIVCLDDG
jgi:hypothetical protein